MTDVWTEDRFSFARSPSRLALTFRRSNSWVLSVFVFLLVGYFAPSHEVLHKVKHERNLHLVCEKVSCQSDLYELAAILS